MAAVAELRVRLLGGLAVEGVPVLSLGSRKGRAVLRRLALAAGSYVATQELVDAAWPEGPPAREADQLAVLVSRLRAVVGAERLERHPAGYALRPDWLDVAALRELVASAEAASSAGDVDAALRDGHAAVSLLQGPLLPEDESEAVEEERRAVERLGTRARLVTAQAALDHGSPWEALDLATAVRDTDAYDEAALRLQLRALAATSRTAVAITTYLEAATLLREELGTEPEPETQQVYLELLQDEPQPRPAPQPPPSTLPGREGELDELERAWSDALAGRPSLVVVEGPPGIGKSTLLQALAARVGDRATVLRAVPHVLGTELPLQPVLDALAGVVDDEALGDDAELLGPLLGRGRAPGASASSFAAVTTTTGRALLLTALEGVLHRLSQKRPVLLLLDDGQSVDATSAGLLQRVTRPGAPHRLLVVVARRSDEGLVWSGGHVPLGTLDRDAVAAVVGEARADDLWQRSGGHPLFLVELARHEGSAPPDTVLAAVAARCAGTDEVAETLRAAAVLGDPDDVDLLAAVVDAPPATVLARLEAAARQGLLVEDGRVLRFAHQLFREAFAAGVRPARATSWHRQAARELAARRTADPLRIAHHAQLGADPLLAAEALTTAAALAGQRYEHTEALALLDRALDLDDDLPRRVARVRVLLLLGRYDEAKADADDALARGAGAAGLELAALVAYFQRDLELALELADEGARTATDPELVVGCWCLAGRALLTLGRLDEALERLREAGDLATGPLRAVATVWTATALAMRAGGPESYRLARSATSAQHDPAVEPYRALALGRSLTALDRPYEALQVFTRLEELVQRQQISRFAGRADNYRSWVLRNLGATEEADAATAAAWDTVGELRDLAHAEAYGHAALDLADAALRTGDLATASTWLDRMTAAPTTPHVMRWRIELRYDLLRGRLALGDGDGDRAAELAEQVRRAAEQLGVPRYQALAEGLTARVRLRQGEPVDLDALERTCGDLAEGAPLESWWLLAELAEDAGRPRLRDLAGRRVDALASGAGPYAERLRDAAHVLLES